MQSKNHCLYKNQLLTTFYSRRQRNSLSVAYNALCDVDELHLIRDQANSNPPNSYAQPTLRENNIKPYRNSSNTKKYSTSIFSNSHIKSMLLSQSSSFRDPPNPKPIKEQLLYKATNKSIIYIKPTQHKSVYRNTFLEIKGKGKKPMNRKVNSVVQNSSTIFPLLHNANLQTLNGTSNYANSRNSATSTTGMLSQFNKQLCSKLIKCCYHPIKLQKPNSSTVVISRLKLMLLGRKYLKASFIK